MLRRLGCSTGYIRVVYVVIVTKVATVVVVAFLSHVQFLSKQPIQ